MDVRVVELFTGGTRTELSTQGAPQIIPASAVTIHISGTDLPAEVLLDGRTVPLARSTTGDSAFLALDLWRSVGFHALELDRAVYLFGTDDAKLRLDGVERMLKHIEDNGLSWGGQITFSDGSTFRNPKTDYAWLAQRWRKIVEAAREIAARPFRTTATRERVTRTASGRLLLQPTFNLFRHRPRMYLEEAAGGLLTVAGRQYDPAMVVQSKRHLSLDTIGNRRVADLLLRCASLADSLLAAVPTDIQAELRRIRAALADALDLHPFAAFASNPGNLPPQPSREEVADERYALVFDLWDEATGRQGWDPGHVHKPTYAYAKYADEIYQAFVAIVLAGALGVPLTEKGIIPRLDTPLFKSADLSIYYDTVPPPSVARNWRDESARPSEMRPDLTLVDQHAKKYLMFDAKYRVDSDGRPSASALTDCQVYLNAYACPTICVCYPGSTLAVTKTAGAGFTIIEIPIAPVAELSGFLTKKVIPAVRAEMNAI